MGKKNRKKKVRVAFRKNREQRTRMQDLTKRANEDLEAVEDMASGERLTGKGDVTRHRTIVADEMTDDGQVIREIDASNCVSGRVLYAIGANNCRVRTEDGRDLMCSVRRVLRTLSRDTRNVVVAGDRVLLTQTDDETGVIERVEARASVLTRGSRREAHVIVSNVDQAVIVTSVAQPDLKVGLIDRFLCSTAKGGIQSIICINKIDLGNSAELQPIVGQYAQLGYPVLLTSFTQNIGIDALRELLVGKETVFTGQSGVGKSSLLNAVQPGLGQATSEVSDDTNKGRHTTRVAELLSLEDGGWIVDTPGIRQLQLWDVIKEEVEEFFIEFRPFVAKCRYPSCSHTHEDRCGVKAAVDQHLISPIRYESYLRIFHGDDS